MSATGAVGIANAFPTMPDSWWGVLVDATGSTLVFGERSTATSVQPLVGRLTDALELDPAFGPEGHARIGAVESYQLPSGDLFSQVQATNTAPERAEHVIHISTAGIIDASFGEAGRSRGDGTGVGLARGADGEIWAAGHQWPDTIYVRRI